MNNHLRTIITGLLALLALGSALTVVYAKHENRKLFVDLQRLHAVRDNMNIEWGQLQLEQSSLATQARIEAAAHAINMVSPAPETIVMVRP